MNKDISELEIQVLNTAKNSVAQAISDTFSGYNNPLNKLCGSVVDSHSDELKEIFEDSIRSIVKSDDFRKSVKEAMNHKIARALVSKMEGTVDQAVNTLRQDPTIKAKMVIAIENIIKENEL
ncbi:hypothetical protein [Agarilytica rhodophyticola]|uniref:hypothetical protein n=1 Tax=Agarilytica rhodophyticola TaxID=1737490 RepID=UPI000B342C13|nr:hypothetical protein [Agarilytica rhodophyticola]